MLRRSDKPQSTAPAAKPADEKPTGPKAPNQAPKGYATPSRKEAEAARKARLGALPTDPKLRKKAIQSQRSTQYQIERQAIRDGDERNYPLRDLGPVRKFARDYVDGRLRVLEFTLPVVVLCYIALIFGGRSSSGSALITVVMLLSMLSLIVFGFLLSSRIKKAITEKFGADQARGISFYAFSRAVNPRFLRKPRPTVTASGKPKV